jgi:hypothetical protein
VQATGRSGDTLRRSYGTQPIFYINYINCTILGPGPTNSNVDNFGVYEIFRSRFSRACTWTVANVPQNYNSLGSWFGGKMGVRKKNFSKKKFFSRNFSASFSTYIVDTWGLRRQPKHGGPISYRFRVMGGQKFSPKKF